LINTVLSGINIVDLARSDLMYAAAMPRLCSADAIHLATAIRLRSADAIHLGTAIRLQTDVLVAYDGGLVAAAAEAGLSTSTQ
jgi:predicted nucleic acid-binding protein